MNQNVLNKLLSRHIDKKETPPKPQKKPGRPKLTAEKKARNFTLCLAPEYLKFLDKMIVKDRKVKGRGRKIRFIIDRFIEHERRSIEHLKVLKRSLMDVTESINKTKKNNKEIDRAVDNVHTLLKVLNYSPKTLQKMLPKEDWRVLSFCLDWRMNKGIRL
jgi:hypothetical protein